MFQKRRAQGHKADMCVTVIGDHSGSMAGEKLTRELYTVVALAEIFAELDIPFYFSASMWKAGNQYRPITSAGTIRKPNGIAW